MSVVFHPLRLGYLNKAIHSDRAESRGISALKITPLSWETEKKKETE